MKNVVLTIKSILIPVFCICFIGLNAQNNKAIIPLKLWYTEPATDRNEALPMGNGKTGAMVFGGTSMERLQINDATLWSGSPIPGNVPDGPKHLQEIRSLIFNNQFDSAANAWNNMRGPYSARYLTMADLWLNFANAENEPTKYYRDLDLKTATTTVKYTLNGVEYTRVAMVSHAAKALIIRITANKPNAISFNTTLNSKLQYKTTATAPNYLVLKGKAPKYVAHRKYEPQQVVYDGWDGEGMNFETHVQVINQGGTVLKNDSSIAVQAANAVTIYLTTATSFIDFKTSAGYNAKNPSIEATQNMLHATKQGFGKNLLTHIADYQTLFNRVDINLGKNLAVEKLPTNVRLSQYQQQPGDLSLPTLLYQFGRYLLISASRPGSRPTNLQGIWCDYVQPPWGSNYTMNINTEMNYWLAETTNLSECHEPLFNFIQELAYNGAITAKTNYGINKGWVAHHNSDLWAKSSPPGGQGWPDPMAKASWGAWPMSGAWLSTHLWEHYQFTGDKTFLRSKAYPLLKGAAEFMLQWLIPDNGSGYLITNPSSSPENTLKIDGKQYEVSKATTMDMAIIKELFTDVIHAAEVLEIDADFCSTLVAALNKMYPYQIGRLGQLQEWYGDWDVESDKHRHISHLFGLYPGNHINVLTTPALAAAAKKTLEMRGDVSTGWSMAWKINWWARLQEGNHAFKILTDEFTYLDPRNPKANGGKGGIYPNMFAACPPFQIDANFGSVAGITEMMLQSHQGFIALLPAMPTNWQMGHVYGLKARGNFTINIDWKAGQLAKATIQSGSGGVCTIRTLRPVKVVEVPAENGQAPQGHAMMAVAQAPKFVQNTDAQLLDINNAEGYFIHFKTQQGKTYTIVPL